MNRARIHNLIRIRNRNSTTWLISLARQLITTITILHSTTSYPHLLKKEKLVNVNKI